MLVEADSTSGRLENLPLSSRVQTVASGDVKVAVDISVCWETQMTYYIDDVTADIK